MEPLEFHGPDTTQYWIKVSETEFGVGIYDTISISLDFYPLGFEPYVPKRIYYRGRAPPESDWYWGADVVPPVLTWDATPLGMEEVESLPERQDVRVYPNPANSIINLAIVNRDIDKPISIYDATGRKVDNIYSNLETGVINLNVGTLSSGIYYATWIELDLDKGIEVKKEQFIVVK